jgi:hypothetical protein
MLKCSPSVMNLIENKSIHPVLYQNDENFSRVTAKKLVCKPYKLFGAGNEVFLADGGLTKKYQIFVIKK